MKRTLLMAFTVWSVTAGTQALAQTAVVEVSPEQRTTIREYVVKQKPRSVAIKGDVRVGAPLPVDVALVPVPGAWGPQFSRYRYVYWNERVVLVDPKNRHVVHIVE